MRFKGLLYNAIPRIYNTPSNYVIYWLGYELVFSKGGR